MTDKERLIVTSVTGYMMLRKDEYPMFFKYIKEKTGITITREEELNNPEIWDKLYQKNEQAFMDLMKK